MAGGGRQFAGNNRRFPGSEIIYCVDYDTDGSSTDGTPTSSAAAIVFTPTTQAVVLVIAGVEYPVDITGAARVEFTTRTLQSIRYGYEEEITQGENYRTLEADDEKYLDFGMGRYSGNLYFSSSVAGTVVELEVWKRAD